MTDKKYFILILFFFYKSSFCSNVLKNILYNADNIKNIISQNKLFYFGLSLISVPFFAQVVKGIDCIRAKKKLKDKGKKYLNCGEFMEHIFPICFFYCHSDWHSSHIGKAFDAIIFGKYRYCDIANVANDTSLKGRSENILNSASKNFYYKSVSLIMRIDCFLVCSGIPQIFGLGLLIYSYKNK